MTTEIIIKGNDFYETVTGAVPVPCVQKDKKCEDEKDENSKN